MSPRSFFRLLAACLFGMLSLPTSDVLAGKPIPCGEDAYTCDKLEKDLNAYKFSLLDLYEKHTKDPPQVRKLAKAFSLGLFNRAKGDTRSPTWKELDEKGDKFLANGEADPLVLVNIGAVKLQIGKNAEAKAILTKAHENFSSSSYPASWKFRGCNRLRSAFIATRTPPQEWRRYLGDFVRLMVESMVEAADEPKNRRAVWLSFACYVEAKPEDPGAYALQTAIYDAVQKAEKIDPWMKNMVCGWHHYTLGWGLRGNGTADTVTEEGMKAFKENMAKAAEYFTKAWEIDPALPEAASSMIQVSMGGGDETLTPRDWFDRAVEAQMDYNPAYTALTWSLRPRWGGSHSDMYQFGLECLATKRFDTNVPDKLIQALVDIDYELGGKGEVWRRKGVYDKAKIAFEGAENDLSRRNNPGFKPVAWSLTAHFLAAAQAGQYDDARAVWDKLGDKPCLDVFPIFAMRYPYDAARIYALTAKENEDARTFDAMVADNKYRDPAVMKSARELVEKVAAKDSDPKAKPYFDYWKTRLRWQDEFDKGQWVELTFDKQLSMWQPIMGDWTAVDEHTVSSVGKSQPPQQRLKCGVSFGAPFEVECDLDLSDPESKFLTGLMVGDIWNALPEETGCFFSASAGDKVAYFSCYLGRKAERIHVADPHKCHLRLRYWNPNVEFFIDGQLFTERVTPTLPTHDTITLAYLHGKAQFRNVRIRKVSFGPPPPDDKYAECLAYFEEAIRRDPKDAYAYFERGEAHKGLGQIDAAIADYRKAAELSPNWADLDYVLAKTEYQHGHNGQALEALDRYSKLIDDNPNLFGLRARIQATAIEKQYRDGKAAVANAKRACDISGYNQWSGLETLAAAYAEAGDFDDAVKWAKKALDLAPGVKKGKFQKEVELYQSRKPLRIMPAP